jgi:N-methylhydantoinase A/oxoprolinase/acetone carboxylase beta subunit
MRQVKVHKHAGVLSAYGLVLADVVNEQQQAWMKPVDGWFFNDIYYAFFFCWIFFQYYFYITHKFL